MSSSFPFYFRKFPSTIIAGWGSGPLIMPFTFQSVKNARQPISSSINCGPRMQVPLLCHHRLSRVGSGTINFRQTRSLAAPNNYLTSLDFKMRQFHTDPHAAKAVKRRGWDTWSSPSSLRRKQINQHFGLGKLYRTLDEELFSGLLGNRVVLRWVEAPSLKLDWLSRTILISDPKRGPRPLIEVMRPLSNGPWTLEIIQERSNAVLYEMTRLHYLMYNRNCISLLQLNTRAMRGGRSGDGALFRRLLRKVEQEANCKLKGLQRRWQLISTRG